ncbi:tripartite tricarboxylate transporter substrate binding protein [Comamonadaceae bacterium G21597-S1]|nr:tripartite tricarboxylate transporter substrate binding protein [Comamonadaceae bacterium G21597-S1]
MKKYLAACAVAVFATTALAQSQWPDKPVRLIVPYPPGGNVDSAARIISERLGAVFNQQFLVENKAGAGGLIAGEFVARSAPDGYTFFVGANGPILFAPLIFKRDVYHWKKDFVPVSSVSFTSLVLQVNPSTPYKTVAQLLEAGRNPAVKLSMASPGAGTTNHLLSELVQEQSGAKWLTVQYKGNAPATSDLLGGQVDFNFDQVSVALPFIKDGRTRALAVSSPKRLSQLPDVPTLQEAGFKGLTAETFTGVLAPKGTPPEIVRRLSDALQKVLAEKGVQDKFAGLGAESRGSQPEQFTEYLTAEDERWTPIIKKINITSQ